MFRPVTPFCATLIGLLAISRSAEAHREFGYNGAHGPSHWGDDYQTCIGKHQSPINIEEHDVRNASYSSLEFSGLDVPRTSQITNNGHTVMLVMNVSVPARIFGGPLANGTYVFEQMHFHWGENDTEGSEDLINNHSFAMELHAVFFKEDYRSMTDAIHHSDGLAVLAYFFEADDEPNLAYDQIVTILPRVEAVDSKDVFTDPLRLEDFLKPKDLNLQNYFTYSGSLTTPPCSEVVTWIDFKEPLRLSHKQDPFVFDHRYLSNQMDLQKIEGQFWKLESISRRFIHHLENFFCP
ncbi:carbonic anhydrase 2-like isoform X2 [Belonocnema kinseyi]|uniref:carbonic anhydrase 2-like isoform X2 n=1 Tax=Belonocnema kinseyi TaxID=2817044 RepID=UPI00143CDF40|nr:carbonic anhydrase 2-like isoform X2 [Belonocnema kinseyi]